MLWILILFSVYSVGRTLSKHELNAILNATRPTTKKRKNTYIIKPTFLHRFKIIDKFDRCPVRVVSINGTPVKSAFASIILSGRVARQIAESESTTRTYTIIEYLDKYTTEPVLTLLPNKQILPTETTADTFNRLNHASRRDLLRLIQKQKQKN